MTPLDDDGNERCFLFVFECAADGERVGSVEGFTKSKRASCVGSDESRTKVFAFSVIRTKSWRRLRTNARKSQVLTSQCRPDLLCS